MPLILVAVDTSEGSRRASEFVDRFFAGMDATIKAVNVARTPPGMATAPPYGAVYTWPWWPGVSEREREAFDEALAEERQAGETVAYTQAPADADIDVVFGEAVDAISAAAEEENADLIVVGANDKGFLERLMTGSVSEDLAREAPRPVLIVR
jgi:nucleotide-binding universal stress UspA family protein